MIYNLIPKGCDDYSNANEMIKVQPRRGAMIIELILK
jgi:hypothetical protein